MEFEAAPLGETKNGSAGRTVRVEVMPGRLASAIREIGDAGEEICGFQADAGLPPGNGEKGRRGARGHDVAGKAEGVPVVCAAQGSQVRGPGEVAVGGG
jgi:hypothetical protein